MPSIRVMLTAEPLSVTHGEWCTDCALPSAFTANVALLINGDLQQVVTMRRCVDCGATQ